MQITLSTRSALIVFIVMVVFIIAQAAWWVVFMAQLVDEKVEMAETLGASPEFVEQIHQQEIRRQIMVGTEGTVILLLCLVGIWLIYRALVSADRNKAQQENFLMAATHELKTPLASLRLSLDTLQSDRISAERKAEVLPRMKQDVLRLEHLMDNVLQAVRLQNATPVTSRETIELSSLLDRVVTRFDDLPSRVPSQVSRAIQSNVKVEGDAVALERVFDALLDNAFKYHDGTRIAVSVVLKADDSRAWVEIEDQGIGLERRELDTVFERFYRVGNELTRSAPGTGLGLYIVKETVLAHGGEVGALSDGPGTGTRFRIWLPLSTE